MVALYHLRCIRRVCVKSSAGTLHIWSAQAPSYLTHGDSHTTPAVETNANEKERQDARKTTGVEGVQEAGEEPRNETISMEELKGIKAAITKLHLRSGHPTNTALANCLRARGVPKHVVQLALKYKCYSCHSCQEVRLPTPHAKVSMHKSNTQWDTLQLDIGQLHVGNTVIHFLVLLDEASHFASACELFRHSADESRNATASEIILALETHWVQHRGLPGVMRTGPEGSFRGYNLNLWAQERGVELVHPWRRSWTDRRCGSHDRKNQD